MSDFSHLGNADTEAIDDLYQQYLKDENSVDESWKQFFNGFEFASKNFPQKSSTSSPLGSTDAISIKENNVVKLINEYRWRGHLFTKTNPVRNRREYSPKITLERFGLDQSDLEKVFVAGELVGLSNAKLKDIIDLLEETYCDSVGAEFLYIRTPDIVEWLQKKMESTRNKTNFGKEDKKHIMYKLNQAVSFEQFLHSKFIGQKRFSLEGLEAIIPALDAVVEKGAELGIQEFVIGMAHRGRLNVLANVLEKEYEKLFFEFSGEGFDDGLFNGDVKYHLGYSTDKQTRSGKNVHLSLNPNPSHLEAVNPVVEGVVKSKIEQRYDNDLNKCAPILLHGDASIAGQGIIYEVLQMSQLEGYKTGGTIHIVLNNQVGFTTNYLDARSSTYCTDVGKTTLSPVFHVNGDDIEAVVHTVNLALEFRQKFNRDVFIDILGYRKHGHNEGDEPRFTQPTLYQAIAKHENPRELYKKQLLSENSLKKEEIDSIEKDFKDLLQKELDHSKMLEAEPDSYLAGDWKGIRISKAEDFEKSPVTGVKKENFISLAKEISTLPSDRKFFKKIEKIFEARLKMVDDNNLDWAMGELMAYATLLNEGRSVRISGQDCERGTFSHRHAVLTLEDSTVEYVPLEKVTKNNSQFKAYNSHLSEYGVLGFELGYAMAQPNNLTIWEAQFGDFANGAQIIIDQFLASSETKWQRMNGLVLFLPHGYEGQGPEHSSARLERFLELCGEFNLQIVNSTTPANHFHALRRQLVRDFRKPLVVMTPKSLLRHPKCVSKIEDFTEETVYQEVIDDKCDNPEQIERIVFCSGKIYYDLEDHKSKNKIENAAVVRLEQLYPFPEKQLEDILKQYSNAKTLIWAQEEPENMGAWPFILRKFKFGNIIPVTRKESATPATGFHKTHAKEQSEIVQKALSN